MTLFADLSPYSYKKSAISESTVNVGWLDPNNTYPKGPVPSDFVMKLWQFCMFPLVSTRGFHTCEFCHGRQLGPLEVTRESETLLLGTAEIRVFGANETIYAAPDLIYHYVTEHNYQPPEVFISAVLNGAVPPSEDYQTLLSRINIS